MEELRRNDPTNLAGMAQLINQDNVKAGFDVESLEREIIDNVSGQNYMRDGPVNPSDDFKKQLDSLSFNNDSYASGKSEIASMLSSIDEMSSSENFDSSIIRLEGQKYQTF